MHLPVDRLHDPVLHLHREGARKRLVDHRLGPLVAAFQQYPAGGNIRMHQIRVARHPDRLAFTPQLTFQPQRLIHHSLPAQCHQGQLTSEIDHLHRQRIVRRPVPRDRPFLQHPPGVPGDKAVSRFGPGFQVRPSRTRVSRLPWRKSWPLDPEYPVVCMEEQPIQLLKEPER
jgi:hypothetical protein